MGSCKDAEGTGVGRAAGHERIRWGGSQSVFATTDQDRSHAKGKSPVPSAFCSGQRFSLLVSCVPLLGLLLSSEGSFGHRSTLPCNAADFPSVHAL